MKSVKFMGIIVIVIMIAQATMPFFSNNVEASALPGEETEWIGSQWEMVDGYYVWHTHK